MKNLPSLLLAIILLPLFTPTQAQDSLNMRKIFQWEISDSTTSWKHSDVWGWYDEVKKREYAILGSDFGLHFFDLTDPANIQLVEFVPAKRKGKGQYDFKNKGKYLYTNAPMMVIDMSPLPDSVKIIRDSIRFFGSAHNIFIENDRLYACSTVKLSPLFESNTLMVFDISNSRAPRLLKKFPTGGSDWVGVHDIYVRNDTAYMHCFDEMVIVDFTNVENYQILAQFATYPYKGLNHSGWLHADGTKYVMADETRGMPMKYLDVSDLNNIEIDSYLFPELSFPVTDSQFLAHNPIIKDDYVFASCYHDGVYVWDMKDPKMPVLAAFYDTYPDSVGRFSFSGAWGIYPNLPSGLILASDMQTGLYVFEADLVGFPLSVKEDLRQNDILIYPNPVTDHLMIKSKKPLYHVTINLFDLQGRAVMERREAYIASRLTWEMEADMVPGFYFLKIKSDLGILMQKILIN